MGPHSCACNLTTDLHPVGSVWGGTRWDWSGTFPAPLSWRSSTPSLCTWTQPQDSRGKGQSSPWGPPDRSGWCLQGAFSYSCWGLPPTRKMYPFYFSKQPFSILYNEVMCFFCYILELSPFELTSSPPSSSSSSAAAASASMSSSSSSTSAPWYSQPEYRKGSVNEIKCNVMIQNNYTQSTEKYSK